MGDERGRATFSLLLRVRTSTEGQEPAATLSATLHSGVEAEGVGRANQGLPLVLTSRRQSAADR